MFIIVVYIITYDLNTFGFTHKIPTPYAPSVTREKFSVFVYDTATLTGNVSTNNRSGISGAIDLYMPPSEIFSHLKTKGLDSKKKKENSLGTLT